MKYPEHFQQAYLPTPIVPFQKYFNFHPEGNIWLKRDDLTGIELSGNKVRKLDFLLKDAQEKGARRVITCGGLQSNHCRSTAFYATQLGFKTTLVLRGSVPEHAEGNYFLNRILGVDIRLVTAEEYKEADKIMAELAAQSAEPAYIIPEGGSNEVGAWGYIKAFDELMSQKPDTDTIVVATGSGGTHTGLLLGKLLSGSDVDIVSVNVCDDADFFVRKIDATMHAFCERYQKKLNWTTEDIKVIDGFVGEGYGMISSRETEVIRRLARTEGIVIDPVYGAKALAGFEDHLKQGWFKGKEIVFIHTGGIFGVFPYADHF